MVDAVPVLVPLAALLVLYWLSGPVVRRVVPRVYRPEVSVDVHGSLNRGWSAAAVLPGHANATAAEPAELERFDPEDAWGTLVLAVTVRSNEPRDVSVGLELRTAPDMSLWFGEIRDGGETLAFESRESDGRRLIQIEPRTVPAPDGRYPLVFLALPLHVETTYGRLPVEAAVTVTVDATAFALPVLDRSLPRRVGRIRFPPIERRFDVLGPATGAGANFRVIERA